MAKSKARKHREKMIREGKRNPVENRGIYVLADMRTRRTKTKAEKLQQQKYKGRISYHNKEDFDLFTFYSIQLIHDKEMNHKFSFEVGGLSNFG